MTSDKCESCNDTQCSAQERRPGERKEDFADRQALQARMCQIEHKILRARYTEPRIHFALVCASESCPPLRPEAYRAADLDHQLDDQARTFLRDPAKNRYDADQGVLYLSKIFSWFEGDFEAHSASVSAYVEPYLLVEAGQAVRSGDVPIRYLPYDWSLNGR